MDRHEPGVAEVVGARGTAWNWDFDGSFNYSQNTAQGAAEPRLPAVLAILPLLNSGPREPVRAEHAGRSRPGAVPPIHRRPSTRKLYGYGFDFKGSSDIYKLPAGLLALAARHAVGARRTDAEPVRPLQNGDASATAATCRTSNARARATRCSASSTYRSSRNLEGNLAVRYDHYERLRQHDQPEGEHALVADAPAAAARLVGHGLPGPTLYQLWNPADTGPVGRRACPTRCAVRSEPASANDPDCNTSHVVTFGGNPCSSRRRRPDDGRRRLGAGQGVLGGRRTGSTST